MTRGDNLVALPFMALILAAFARHNSLPFQRGGLLQAPGESQYQGQQTPSLPLLQAEGLMPSQMHSDSMVREGDTYHLPLAALRHGLSDALAWNEALAKGAPVPGTRPPPESLTRAKVSFFFGESNGTTFAALRDLYGLSQAEYLASLESGFEIFASNSKSRQFFCFTGDKKFIIKTMSDEELRALTAILADYQRHMADNPHSLLVHYCGHYHVRLYRERADEWDDVHFLVMRNLMTPPQAGLSVQELYDVKGSTVGRAASQKERAKASAILKDLDLMERAWPIDFGDQREAFLGQMASDVEFLRAKGVMDYSLLLGVCPAPSAAAVRGLSSVSKTGAPSGQGFPQRMLSYFLGPPPSQGHGKEGLLGNQRAAAGGRGGVESQGGWVVVHPQGREVYVVGVIDVLQLYNRRKQAETLLKSVLYKRTAISAVDPGTYAARFSHFVEGIVHQHFQHQQQHYHHQQQQFQQQQEQEQQARHRPHQQQEPGQPSAHDGRGYQEFAPAGPPPQSQPPTSYWGS